MLKRLLSISLTVLISAANLSAENIVLVHADTGTYNRKYYDLHYLDNNETTFGVRQSTFGVEFTHINNERISTGGGFAFTNMAEGRVWNLNHYETHPTTIVIVPYIFSGYSFDYFGCELGISCYLQFSEHDAEFYYLQDGSMSKVENSGLRLDRKHSFTFINADIRMFKENSLHLKIRIGRENFDPVDSLISFALVYPVANHQFEYYLSFLTISNYLNKLVEQDDIMKTNQTTGICYMYGYRGIGFGVRTGVLIYNAHGGDGMVPVLHRLNGGIFTVMKW